MPHFELIKWMDWEKSCMAVNLIDKTHHELLDCWCLYNREDTIKMAEELTNLVGALTACSLLFRSI